MSKYNIFVINLEENIQRREFIKLQLDAIGADYEIIKAINGKKLTDEELFHYTKNPNLSRPAIGCSLSHLKIYNIVLKENLPYAIILEDDALLSLKFPFIMDNVCKIVNASDEIVVLFNHCQLYNRWRKINIYNNINLFPVKKAYGAYGYLITYKAAEKLATAFLPVNHVADAWNYLIKNRIVRILAVVPYCIGHSVLGLSSSLESDRKNNNLLYLPKKKSLKDWLYRRIIHQFILKPYYKLMYKSQSYTF